jgi:hypothetical protein
MNKKQLVVMWIGIAAFVIIGLLTKSRVGRVPRDGYNDYSPLIVRLTSTALVTAGLIYTLKDKKPKDK